MMSVRQNAYFRMILTHCIPAHPFRYFMCTFGTSQTCLFTFYTHQECLLCIFLPLYSSYLTI
jgi:hypothetical protein